MILMVKFILLKKYNWFILDDKLIYLNFEQVKETKINI